MVIYMALYMEINKKYTIKFCRLHSYFLKKSKLNIIIVVKLYVNEEFSNLFFQKIIFHEENCI